MHSLLYKFTPLPNNESLKPYGAEYRTNSQCSSQVWQSFISQLTEKLVVRDLPSFHGSQSFHCRVRKDLALYHIRARPSTLFEIHLKCVQRDRQFTYTTLARSLYVCTSSAIPTVFAILFALNSFMAI
jgi:hypothetical protein